MTTAWAEIAARQFESHARTDWATPGDLARHLDPRTVQTPMLDLLDAELVQLMQDSRNRDTAEGPRLIVAMPPQEGKALALDTPIATPTGWTTMGDIQVGDQVFGGDGRPCTVTWVSPVWSDRETFNVLTGDGEKIVADGAHEWVARVTREGPTRILNTRDLARRRSKNPQVIDSPVLELPDADLPLDPYVLGAWLGDGHTTAAMLTSADSEVTDRIRNSGVPCRKGKSKYAWTFVAAGSKNGACSPMRRVLVELGVWGNKHIPVSYMRGSRAQRLALLQGLIDTDGYVSPKGQVEFTSTLKGLAEQVVELVFTLGAKATMGEGRATIAGRDCGPKYRVKFMMADAAHLKRKAVKCRDSSVGAVRYVWAEPTDSVPTVCIEVDSPDHTFLAGRTLLKTHNSQRVSRRFALWALLQNPELRVAISSYEANVARRWGRVIREDINQNPDLGLHINAQVSAQHEWELGGGHIGGVFTSGVGGALTGRPVDLLIIDDPVKDREQAESETYRERAVSWWTDTAKTRLAPGAPAILIMTRWHPDDLAGWLLKNEPNWKLLSIPAQCEDPALDPLGRELNEWMVSARGRRPDEWEALKAGSTLRTWQSLYQQRPTPSEGLVFKRPWIDNNRKPSGQAWHNLVRVLVSVDPAAKSKKTSDETGIIVVGLDKSGHAWVLDDRTLRGSPTEWGLAAWTALIDWRGTEIVVEDNQGGDMVTTVLDTTWNLAAEKHGSQMIVPVVTQITANQSKRVRAEAAAALYELGRVHHASDGTDRLKALEDQMTTWTGDGSSPDRIDALVHGLRALSTPRTTQQRRGTRTR